MDANGLVVDIRYQDSRFSGFGCGFNGFDLVVSNLQGRGQEGWLWTPLVMGLCLLFWKI
jgi:hypothetical protein